MEGKEVKGIVKFASPNGVSLMLMFDDYLGGYAGIMPVLYDCDTEVFKDLIQWKDVKIKSWKH